VSPTRVRLARLLLGQLGKAPPAELAQLVRAAGFELAGLLQLPRSDRRHRHLAAVSRAIELRSLTAMDSWRAVGLAKRVG